MKKVIFSVLYLLSMCLWLCVKDNSDFWIVISAIALSFVALLIFLRNIKEAMIITLVIVVIASFVFVPMIAQKSIVSVEARVTDIQHDFDVDSIIDTNTYVSYYYENTYYENVLYSEDTDARYEIGDTVNISIDENNPSKVHDTSMTSMLFLVLSYLLSYAYVMYSQKPLGGN